MSTPGSRGGESHSDEITIDFEGTALSARRGETVASALTAHDVRAFRTTRSGAERGVFCGMGVCQDCLVEIDGRANERACVRKIDASVRVRREWHDRPLESAPSSVAPLAIDDLPTLSPDVLVVGGGPGGLSAARAARCAGASVLLLDEAAVPGGQYFKQQAVESSRSMDLPPPDGQHREGAQLVADARAVGVDLRSSAVVWGAFPPLEFAATIKGETTRIVPRAAIIATGAYDRPWPIPGWTLPGVMTTGAAQSMWRATRRLPGRRICVAGNGPLNLQLAAELIGGGAQVLAVVEAAPAPGILSLPKVGVMLASAPGLVAEGARYLRACRRAATPLDYDSLIRRIERYGGNLIATIAGPSARELEVDVVCLGYGFYPSNELLRALGCTHRTDPRTGQRTTVRDANCETTVGNVFALGDCVGIGGARVALAEGTIAGLAAARAAGHMGSTGFSETERRARRELERQRRFQQALWRLYTPAKPLVPASTPNTIICRCEEVTFADLVTALKEGVTSTGAIKQRTRIGMGRCQGRYCAPTLETYLAQHESSPRDERSGFAPRVPIKPVTIAELATPSRE